MGRQLCLLAVAAVLGPGCKPAVGRSPSLIVGPEILAMRGQPAEGEPGQKVTYDILVASPEGTLTDAVAAWDVCLSPKPPSESNAVASACVTAAPGDAVGATFEAPLPSDACSLFGPIAPPKKAGQPDFRPRDPDTTGGYYVPVRAVVNPADSTRSLMAFDLERVRCHFSNAPLALIQDFNMRYTMNINPHLQGLEVVASDQTRSDVLAGAATVPSGGPVDLVATATDDSIETFPVFDAIHQQLSDQQETLRFFWYAPEGDFLHDRTGVDPAAVDISSSNRWTAPVVTEPTVVPLWLVMRDSRGGTDFVSTQLTVAP
jgi:hypothetical protein